jgi:hypothetical protein
MERLRAAIGAGTAEKLLAELPVWTQRDQEEGEADVAM